MKIEAILVIANVPSVFKSDRVSSLGYNRFGYQTMVWELEYEKGYYWTVNWVKHCTTSSHTTNHEKKNRIAYKLHKERGLPIIHINKKRAILFDRNTQSNRGSEILKIPFRNSDLYLRQQ